MVLYIREDMSHLMTKPTKWHVRPIKTQFSLGIHSVCSEPTLCVQWVAKLHADSEDSDQIGRMTRLIWVFAGLLALSWDCSYMHLCVHWFNYQSNNCILNICRIKWSIMSECILHIMYENQCANYYSVLYFSNKRAKLSALYSHFGKNHENRLYIIIDFYSNKAYF